MHSFLSSLIMRDRKAGVTILLPALTMIICSSSPHETIEENIKTVCVLSLDASLLQFTVIANADWNFIKQ